MDELGVVVERLLPGAQVLNAEQLRGSNRSIVHRVRLRDGNSEQRTVVVKAYVAPTRAATERGRPRTSGIA